MPGAEPNLARERAAGSRLVCRLIDVHPNEHQRTPSAPNGYPRRIPGLPWNDVTPSSGESRPRLKCVGLASVGTARPSSKVPGATFQRVGKDQQHREARVPLSPAATTARSVRWTFAGSPSVLRDVRAVAPARSFFTNAQQQPGALDRVSVMLDPPRSTLLRVPPPWSVSPAPCALPRRGHPFRQSLGGTSTASARISNVRRPGSHYPPLERAGSSLRWTLATSASPPREIPPLAQCAQVFAERESQPRALDRVRHHARPSRLAPRSPVPPTPPSPRRRRTADPRRLIVVYIGRASSGSAHSLAQSSPTRICNASFRRTARRNNASESASPASSSRPASCTAGGRPPDPSIRSTAQSGFATAANTDHTYISRVEHRQDRSSLGTLARLLDALGATVDDLGTVMEEQDHPRI